MAVLREINAYTISQISQSVEGLWRFDYKNIQNKLKFFSLDRDFSGILNTKLNLEVATFDDLIVDSKSITNTSYILEIFFGITNLNLKRAEGIAIHLAYNNIIRLIIGSKKLKELRKHFIPYARQFRTEISERFPNQQKFCPYTREEQSRYCKLHLTNSQKFIKRFPGTWMDTIFTPVIRNKTITLISEFESVDRKIVMDILEKNIYKVLNDPCFNLNIISSTKIYEAIKFFKDNERDFLL